MRNHIREVRKMPRIFVEKSKSFALIAEIFFQYNFFLILVIY